MKYEVRTIPPFDKEFKALKKKYASIKDDLENLKKELENNCSSKQLLGFERCIHTLNL